ncbi:S8 family serine peptidase [Nonomuraea sp. NPDC000554]|uniref:S8 family peptidase n=1 Tax=Nonomuraea sp. NPDC000554 TaxID=3154259 RepID=UPI0033311056
MLARTLIAVAALAIPLVAVPPAVADTPPADAAAAKSVTLITGDRVTVDGDRVDFEAGPGRKDVRYVTEGTKDDWTLIPLDVAGDVARGVLDRHLFQVPRLIADGLDDASVKGLPLIVQYRAGAAPMTALAGARTLASINAVAATAPRERAVWTQLDRDSSVAKVWLDAPVKASLDRSVPQIGAPEAWQAGFTGEGVKVAVLDTGVDDKHPDLAGRVESARNFTDSQDAVDRHGHGTHVASTIAGQGVAGTPTRKGVAPGARLLNGKVLNDRGSGSTSGIIAGMEWAAQQGAKIINMSLGHPDEPGLDPLEQAVERISASNGVLFVIAAGNDGPGASTLGSPGSADSALTVGAVDSADKLASFSSRGPRVADFAIKPDLTAPGVNITAARAGTTGYIAYSGTSMATPHVAGAAAILAQQHPDWTWQQLKATLVGSVKPGGPLTENGAGRVDVAKAVKQTVTADAGTLSFGHLRWPYEDKPIERTLTYRNSGTAPVTLDLALDAPEGVFKLGATQVTVPANGTAAVTVTAQVKSSSPGAFPGRITATGGGVTVSTLVNLSTEAESYDLHVKMIDQLGTVPDGPDDFMPMTLMPESGGDPISIGINHGDSEGPVRVPAGRYLAYAVLRTKFPDGHEELSVVPVPGLEVKADRELVFDASDARLLNVATDHADARTAGETFTFVQDRKDGQQWGARFSLDRFSLPRNVSPDRLRFRVSPTEGKAPGFHFETFTQLAALRADGTFTDTPYQYNLLLRREGSVPGALKVRDRELGTVRAHMATLRASATGAFGAGPVIDGPVGSYTSWSQAVVSLPATPTWYFTPGMPWRRSIETMPNGRLHQTDESAEAASYQAGRTEKEWWNTGVVGPALPSTATVTRDDKAFTLTRMPLWYPPRPGRSAVTSDYGSGTTTLLRDGQVVGTANKLPGTVTFPVESGSGRFQLVLDGTVDPEASELSAKVRTEWSFTSSGAGPVPLFVLRAYPQLDLDNATRPGVLVLPLRLERMTGATRPLSHVGVEVSRDGASWTRAVVVPTGKDTWKAIVPVLPRQGEFASLRLTARDTAGASVSQTVERAFRVR